MKPRVLACALGALLGLSLGLPAGASAATTAFIVGDEIHIESGPEANAPELSYALFGGFISIEDAAGVVGTPTCPEDSGALECPVTPTTDAIVARMGDGADGLVFGVSYRNFVGPRLAVDFLGGGGDDVFAAIGPGRLLGDEGADRLTGGSLGFEGADPANVLLGGAGDDVLIDDEGDDKLKGGPGGDKLKGGDDRDRYSGGGGKDRVRARDFTQDHKINCGAGDDKLRADPFDPRPKSC